MELNKIYQGDTLKVLKTFPDRCVDTIITSPPYWGLRDYGVEGQIGLEPTLDEYITKLLNVITELKRVLKKTGVMFWNHGDCYASGGNSKDRFDKKNYGGLGEKQMDTRIQGRARTNEISAKCMCLQNYRLILQMIDQGWILRNTIIWHKPNAMPSSVKDRLANAYEPVFMLVKNKKYWFDLDAVRVRHKEQDRRGHQRIGYQGKWKDLRDAQYLGQFPVGKNPGDVWTIPTQPFPQAHFATFPEKLIQPMIEAACPKEICKKCRKARVRITKTHSNRTEQEIQEGLKEQKDRGYTIQARGYAGMKALAKHGVAKKETLGWTDCNCTNPSGDTIFDGKYEAGIVLDPFIGAGTVGVVAKKLNRNWIGIELNKDYIEIANKRIANTMGSMF